MKDATQQLLRYALRANAAFSTVCGIAMIAAFGPLSITFGIKPSWLLPMTGGMLMLFATGLILISFRDAIDRAAAVTAVALDVGWVLGSAVLLLLPLTTLTATGWWAIAIVAETVAVFAVLQFLGLRTSRQAAA